MGLNLMHQIIILVFGISLTVVANENSQLSVPCKPGWYFFGDKCYKYVTTERYPKIPGSPRPKPKHSAAICRENGGRLASIHSNEQQEFLNVFMLLKSMKHAMIGLRSNGDFYWEDGSTYNYTNWDNNQPPTDDHYQPQCVNMLYRNYKEGIGKWRSLTCDFSMPSICQVNKNDNENSPDPRFCSLEEGGGWKYLNSCYHIVNEAKSWEDAEKYCEVKYKGQFVSNLDNNTNIFLNYIQRLSKASKLFWIGIKMRNNSMQKWTSGWHVADKQLNQDLLQFEKDRCVLTSNENVLVASACYEKYPFICEKTKNDNVPVLKKSSSDDWKCPGSSKKWLDLDGEFCYYIETEKLRNWLIANYECGKMGGTLASFHSENETRILHPHVLKTKKQLLIGLQIVNVTAKNFQWADRTDFNYQNWNGREPSFSQACVELRTDTMKWNAITCCIYRGYICKSKKVLSKMEKTTLAPSNNSAVSKDRSYTVFSKMKKTTPVPNNTSTVSKDQSHSVLSEMEKTTPLPYNTSAVSKDQSYSVLSKDMGISIPVPFRSAVSEDQTYSGGISAGTVVGIAVCTLLVFALVGIIVYHSRNIWKRYFVKIENDGLTSTTGFSSHVPKIVIWRPLR